MRKPKLFLKLIGLLLKGLHNTEFIILEEKTYTKIPPPLEKKAVLNFEESKLVMLSAVQMFARFFSKGKGITIFTVVLYNTLRH
jgi:hypothetical protein